jgi:murein DD-endopeptidase MepM/ murein hydrolase activator NlpD
MRLYNPWPEPYTINKRSGYGPRRHPITGRIKMHHGIDVACPVGTPLIAPADGQIVHKGSGASGGYTLLVRHQGNFHTVYYHLKQPSHRHVGEMVKAGDLIGNSGNTGQSTGPHLHFELRRSRKWGDTVDPQPYLIGPYRQGQAPTRPTRPSRLGRVTPGLEALSSSWIARGAHAIKRGFTR